jgi:hypothetical protein
MRQFLIIGLISIGACTKPIDLELPAYSSKIVVNGEFDSEKTIELQITRSLPILQASDSTGYLLKNASVTVFENGNNIGNAIYMAGKYYLNKQPKNGATYRVDITAPNYTKASANLSIPNSIPITASYKDSIGLDADGFKIGQLTVTFTDAPGVSNYYRFMINYYNSGLMTWFPFTIVSNDILFLNNEKQKDGSYLFSDATFSGKSKSLRFNVQSSTVKGSPKFEISIKSFNQDYYQYLQQTNAYNQDGNGFSNDPVILRTNVTDGLGMVGGVSNSKDTIF